MDKNTGTYDMSDSYPALIKKSGKLISALLNEKFKNAGFSITGAQWVALTYLVNEDGLTQQELAAQYDSNKVTVFRLIEKLEAQGLLFRESDPNDRRCKRLYPTPEGRKLQARLTPLARQNAEELTKGICDADLQTTKTVLKAIIRNAG